MTIDEAIKNREDCLKYLEGRGEGASPDCVEAVRWSVKALKALRPVSREQVEKVWRREWIWDTSGLYPKPVCSKCSEEPYRRSNHTSDLPNYCPNCGAPMTDEAVEMVMERMDRCINLT